MKFEQNEEARTEMKGDEAQSPSRRKFLRSSSTAALITSLAAQPVWGQCTVSGAMSGASTSPTNGDACFIPPELYGAGRSPGFWSSAMYNGNAVISAFSSFNGSQAADLRCFIDEVKATSSYTIPETSTTSSMTINVAQALMYPGGTGGNNWNLAGIWLDAYFGFFDGAILPGVLSPTPQDWVEHFFALYVISNQSDSVFNSVFNDGSSSTAWNLLPIDYSCSVVPESN